MLLYAPAPRTPRPLLNKRHVRGVPQLPSNGVSLQSAELLETEELRSARSRQRRERPTAVYSNTIRRRRRRKPVKSKSEQQRVSYRSVLKGSVAAATALYPFQFIGRFQQPIDELLGRSSAAGVMMIGTSIGHFFSSILSAATYLWRFFDNLRLILSGQFSKAKEKYRGIGIIIGTLGGAIVGGVVKIADAPLQAVIAGLSMISLFGGLLGRSFCYVDGVRLKNERVAMVVNTLLFLAIGTLIAIFCPAVFAMPGVNLFFSGPKWLMAIMTGGYGSSNSDYAAKGWNYFKFTGWLEAKEKSSPEHKQLRARMKAHPNEYKGSFRGAVLGAAVAIACIGVFFALGILSGPLGWLAAGLFFVCCKNAVSSFGSRIGQAMDEKIKADKEKKTIVSESASLLESPRHPPPVSINSSYYQNGSLSRDPSAVSLSSRSVVSEQVPPGDAVAISVKKTEANSGKSAIVLRKKGFFKEPTKETQVELLTVSVPQTRFFRQPAKNMPQETVTSKLLSPRFTRSAVAAAAA